MRLCSVFLAHFEIVKNTYDQIAFVLQALMWLNDLTIVIGSVVRKQTKQCTHALLHCSKTQIMIKIMTVIHMVFIRFRFISL